MFLCSFVSFWGREVGGTLKTGGLNTSPLDWQLMNVMMYVDKQEFQVCMLKSSMSSHTCCTSAILLNRVVCFFLRSCNICVESVESVCEWV